MDTTGTEALDGASTPPPIDASMGGNPDAQPSGNSPAAPQPPPDLTGGKSAPPDLGAPAAPAATVAPPARRGGVAGLLDAVADILSPAQQSTRVRDANGNMQTVAAKPLTRGQQWAHVGLEALQGAVAGASAPAGPGHVSRGIAAAVGGQIQQGQQQREAQNEQADHDFAVQQKAKQDNLNYQLGVRDLAAKSFELTRRQVAATQDDITFAQKQEQVEKDLHSFDLGSFPGAMDLHQVMEQQPKFFDRLKNNLIVAVPVIGADGTRAGVHVFERRPEVGAQKAPAGTQFAVWTPGSKPGEAPHMEWKTATEGQYSNDDITRLSQGAMNDSLNYAKTNADIQEKKAQANEANAKASEAPSEISKNNAEAAKTRDETKALNEASSISDIQNNAQQLVNGTMDPANLSKRSKAYDATLAEANRLSMAQTGKEFDPGKAAGDYKFATNPSTYNTLNYLNSLTGRDGKGGNLSVVVQMSNGLHQTSFPALNDAAQWAKLATGNPQIAAYHAALLETSDQVAKILQGGGSGGASSDAKLKQAQELFDKGFDAQQMTATANTVNQLLQNRKKEIIGDNRYLLRWQQPATAAAPAAQGQQPAAQPTQAQQPAAVPATSVSLATARTLPGNQGKTDAQITADIQAHGHKVVP